MWMPALLGTVDDSKTGYPGWNAVTTVRLFDSYKVKGVVRAIFVFQAPVKWRFEEVFVD